VKVTHNLPEGPIASSSADWLTLTPSDEGFTLHITKNESASNRVATFTFSDPNGKAWPVYMNLTQKP
jgi:hypothetical protein